MIYCEYCGFKTNKTEGLCPYKTAPLSLGFPKFVPEENKIVKNKILVQANKFKCPKSGRVVTERNIVKKNEEDRSAGDETSFK